MIQGQDLETKPSLKLSAIVGTGVWKATRAQARPTLYWETGAIMHARWRTLRWREVKMKGGRAIR
jgi:hypothetical protein